MIGEGGGSSGTTWEPKQEAVVSGSTGAGKKEL